MLDFDRTIAAVHSAMAANAVVMARECGAEEHLHLKDGMDGQDILLALVTALAMRIKVLTDGADAR